LETQKVCLIAYATEDICQKSRLKMKIIRIGEISHGYCPECYDNLCKEIEEMEIEEYQQA